MISRTGGRGAVTPYEKVALKDVIYLGTNEKVTVRARYEPWPGMYSKSTARNDYLRRRENLSKLIRSLLLSVPLPQPHPRGQ